MKYRFETAFHLTLFQNYPRDRDDLNDPTLIDSVKSIRWKKGNFNSWSRSFACIAVIYFTKPETLWRGPLKIYSRLNSRVSQESAEENVPKPADSVMRCKPKILVVARRKNRDPGLSWFTVPLKCLRLTFAILLILPPSSIISRGTLNSVVIFYGRIVYQNLWNYKIFFLPIFRLDYS